MSIKVYYSKGSLSGIQYPTTENSGRLLTENNDNLLLSSSYTLNSGNSITPAPTISITPEIYYANDTPIGYTYNLTLNGYASSVNYDSSSPLPSGASDSFNRTLQAIQKIKNLFNFNNGILAITNDAGNVLLSASGCFVREVNFEQNDNNWINYAKYSIGLESNEIQFNSCSGIGQIFGCDTLNIPSGLDNADSPLLLDMTKYKVRSFNDNWSFNASSENIYQDYSFNSTTNLNNQYINVEYTISANGKNYAKYNTADEVYLVPAWENAKNFCQQRLYTVVSRLINNVLKVPDENSLNNLFANPSGTSSIFYDNYSASDSISNSTYGVYNESITCETSESDGSFSATYAAIIKKRNNSGDLINSNTIHTITTTRKVDDDGKKREVVLSVDGEIKGLIEGGLIKNSGILYFPDHGTIFIGQSLEGKNSKFDAALAAYNKIADENGLKSDFASALGITLSALNVTFNCAVNSNPQAASHSVTHNYDQGSISYNTDYNTTKACQAQSKLTKVTIKIDEPTPRIREIVVPGKQNGPVIQRIGADTPRYLTVSIEGYDKTYACIGTPDALVAEICANGAGVANIGIPDLEETYGFTKIMSVENTFNYNRTDGSFNINRKYIVLDLV